MSFIGASGIIVEMLFIGISIEIIIEALKNTKGIGTITGFITNGPEALCLLVGLLVGDVIFAASTPLGSNFMNPVLLIIAAFISSSFIPLLRCYPVYTWTTILFTAVSAILFFILPPTFYIYWIIAVLVITLPLFMKRPQEVDHAHDDNVFVHKIYLIPATCLLTICGYFLDSVVSFAAVHSHAPKGVIGFIVLATLTSWPEFKSCLSLFQRKNITGAMLNITVSNITNIWLAVAGVSVYLLGN
jgi:cation:H+ antiporter